MRLNPENHFSSVICSVLSVYCEIVEALTGPASGLKTRIGLFS